MDNLAHAFLAAHGFTIWTYDGECQELVNDASRWLQKQGIEHHRIWIEGLRVRYLKPRSTALGVRYNHEWKYHAALIVDGLVHDGWFDEPVPLGTYLKQMFGRNTLVQVDHFYEGCSKPTAEVWEGEFCVDPLPECSNVDEREVM